MALTLYFGGLAMGVGRWATEPFESLIRLAIG